MDTEHFWWHKSIAYSCELPSFSLGELLRHSGVGVGKGLIWPIRVIAVVPQYSVWLYPLALS